MSEDGVLVECLSCSQRDTTEDESDTDPDGDWRCPQCSHGVAALVREGGDPP